MPPALLLAVVFIEGFCSLGAEVIALRRLLPHVGSAIVVTAPTIGFFLLALALGYAAGGRIAGGYRMAVAGNFLIAAVLVGAGLSGPVVDGLFAHVQPAWLAYLLFVGGILCPVAWLLGQTVPILTNLMDAGRAGEASGKALAWSTLGSFLGSVSLSLIAMQWLGVWAAVLACMGGLLAGVALLAWRRPAMLGSALLAGLLALPLNLGHAVTADTAYADYRVASVDGEGLTGARAFLVNNSLASLLDAGEPPNTTRYVRHLRHVLLDELAFRDRDILVLGAGGFTLSHREPLNRYTYVDIDPAIRELAERHFLREAVRGEFVVDDARRFVARTEKRFDAVVVDVYSARTAIPGHLLTREFWADTRRALKPDGMLLANLILDGKLETPYARNLLATMESVYGRCAVEVLHKGKPLANVEVACHAGSRPAPTTIYVDERNRADLDMARPAP